MSCLPPWTGNVVLNLMNRLSNRFRAGELDSVTGIEESTRQVLLARARFHANQTSLTDADEAHEILWVQFLARQRFASRIQPRDMEQRSANFDINVSTFADCMMVSLA